MAALDVSGFETLLPIFGFLLVFIIVYSVVNKTKIIGESKFVQLLAAFIISIVFVLAVQPREYIIGIIPWFAVLLVVSFLILAMTGFIGGLEPMAKGIGKGLVVLLLVIFLILAYFVFSSIFQPFVSEVKDLSPKVLGAIVLLVISAVVSWVLVKSK